MKFLISLVRAATQNREWVFGIPVAIAFLLVIASLVSILQSIAWFPISLSEDVGMVVKFSLNGVGLVIALGIAGSFKSWLAGDVDEKTCSWPILLIDSLILCVFVILSLLAVFGSRLWL
jgi:hypothetical protein